MSNRDKQIIERFLSILATDYGKQIGGQEITVQRAVEVLKQALTELGDE